MFYLPCYEIQWQYLDHVYVMIINHVMYYCTYEKSIETLHTHMSKYRHMSFHVYDDHISVLLTRTKNLIYTNEPDVLVKRLMRSFSIWRTLESFSKFMWENGYDWNSRANGQFYSIGR